MTWNNALTASNSGLITKSSETLLFEKDKK